MSTLLTPVLSFPLEREFEAWIVARIEEYFARLGKSLHVWAVSPADEATWPADEIVMTGGKIFGLQFKRPSLGSSKSGPGYSRLFLESSIATRAGSLGCIASRDILLLADLHKS